MLTLTTVLLNIITSVALLFVLTSGLMIIFGLMGVVNLAHGELIMLGIYCAYLTSRMGLSPWLSFIIAPLVLAVFGVVLERVLIRRLYGKLMESVLATWGVGIVLREAIELIFGKAYKPVPYFTEATIPIGSDARYAVYRLVFIVVAVVIGVGFVLIQRKTNMGITVRSVISNADRAATLGVNVNRVYRNSFVVGCALAGLAGAVLAPSTSAYSMVGAGLLINSFMAVLVAGVPSSIALSASSGVLATGQSLMSFLFDPIWGSISLVVIALIVIRLRRSHGV